MSNYTKSTNFASKDSLLHGNPAKVVKGTEIDTEFNSIQTAIATKLDASGGTLTSGTISGGTISGITDLAVADGGTGASTAADARTNLGALSSVDPSYTGTLTGDTGVINVGSGQVYKDSSGNVGIGTSSITREFANYNQINLNGSSGATLQLQSGGSQRANIIADVNNMYIAATNVAYGIIFGVGGSTGTGTERARIDSSGYSRWSDTGSYSYSGTAHSVNNSASNDIIRFFNSNATPYGLFVKYTAADPNNTSSYVFASEQNTGVNIYKIYSNGTVAARSDARWKKNIETARDGYLADLNQLRVVKYNWYNHEDGAAKELGLIAQEVEAVFPNMVVTDNVGEENESKSIKTSVLPFMLLKAIQEQQVIINAQDAVLKQLQADVAALKAA